jgi:hypothetical protein
MWNKRLLLSLLCGLSLSLVMNVGVILWNSDGSHNRAVERFFTIGSLLFPGFEAGVFVVAANVAALTVLLTLVVWALLKGAHFTRIGE